MAVAEAMNICSGFYVGEHWAELYSEFLIDILHSTKLFYPVISDMHSSLFQKYHVSW